MLRFHVSTDIIFLRLVRSRTLCAQWTYPHHVPPVRVHITCYWYTYLCVSRLHFTCSLTLLIWTVDSSTLTVSPYAFPFCLVDSSAGHYSWNSDLFHTRSVSPISLGLFVLVFCVSRSSLYIRLEMGIRPSSSIYFATTLKV